MARYNVGHAISDIGSKLGDALMRIAAMSEDRRQRNQTNALALRRIELDEQNLLAEAVRNNQDWLAKGWTGTPGTEVYEPGQTTTPLPVDLGVDTPSVMDRGITPSPVAMGGAGGGPLAMGLDQDTAVRQFGDQLTRLPQLDVGVEAGSFQPARYDYARSPEAIAEQAQYDLGQQRGMEHLRAGRLWSGEPTEFSVSDGQIDASGVPSLGAAQQIAEATKPEPVFSMDSSGNVSVSGVDPAEIPAIYQQYYAYNPDAPASAQRLGSLTFLESQGDKIDPETRAWLDSMDDESLQTWVTNYEEEERRGLQPAESDRRAAAVADRAVLGYQMIEDLTAEFAGAPGPSGLIEGVTGRFVQSTEVQQYRAAATMVVGASLRWTSGAAISPKEIQQLVDAIVPQVGDNMETAVFKMRGLEAQVGALGRAATLADGRDRGARWNDVGSIAPPEMSAGDRMTQLIEQGYTEYQIDWMLQYEGYTGGY